jgi:ABC-type uncharacterized transport system substrate-binding protein
MNSFLRKAFLPILSCLLVMAASGAGHAQDGASASGKKHAGKKILYINSYNKGYPWSDGIEKGVVSVLGSSGVELRIQYMDTKNNLDLPFKEKAGAEAKAVIDEWKPDLVIASDDNAVHYVVVPYLKDGNIPVIFNGVNWDAKQYGFPCSNVTGMIEVNSADQLFRELKILKPGASRIAVLAADTESERQELKNVRAVYGINYVEERYAATFDEWKKDYLELQDKADILHLQNNYGIKGWNEKEAEEFVRANTRIPTGSNDASYMSALTLLVYSKVPEEQGEWAAQRALEVLDGKPISQIPVSRNVKGQIFVNRTLARKLDITIPQDILNAAQIVE